MAGKLIAVGVGPGNKELLTLKAVRLIQNASIIAYAVNENGYSIAREIVSEYIHPNTREIPLFFSMARDVQKRVEARKKAAEQVIKELRRGHQVTYIAEGDPLIYSTFIHLLEEMPTGIEMEICPGISAYQAGAASIFTPLAKENQQIVILPAFETQEEELTSYLSNINTIVLYKVHSCMIKVIQALNNASRLDQAVLIEFASTEKEKITPLKDYQRNGGKIPYFSLILVSK